ncbi:MULTISPECIES: DUF2269 family protein [Rhizobium/Agrobacterium group]|uniref:DUF2269 domain-containing protein n=1 Tax=Agrobacterium tomkonis CFBP 6623 TaxID=1183432 RepID=A0A1S7NUW2_9HYPH|nr:MULTISPECIES: DUF2269 domain-containing protein [Rhizobium/Agrobacterium group]KRA60996.1 hypothetical protein ASD85_12950 [Rhizobium sp. Root651]QCL89300.1 DUF2269 domain-containing protein [Agrobacterium tumefaciens]TKT66345.1 DUF2269 domain-containing protein [Agrobacterium sp. LC34]CUX11992.1 conserved hypothetical protein; putative membrane protein [Agrobacterium tomkonis CFBP 6623]
MTLEELLRLAHVIGATVLFGTGAGIAFFMVMARRTANPALIAHVAGTVVIADTIFTATAAIIQPVTGYFLARIIGWPLTEGWIALSLGLYVFTGIFWLPVVWIQIQLRNIARDCAATGHALPAQWFRLYRIWFVCGFPAFFAVLGIIWLMLNKPDIPLFG